MIALKRLDVEVNVDPDIVNGSFRVHVDVFYPPFGSWIIVRSHESKPDIKVNAVENEESVSLTPIMNLWEIFDVIVAEDPEGENPYKTGTYLIGMSRFIPFVAMKISA